MCEALEGYLDGQGTMDSCLAEMKEGEIFGTYCSEFRWIEEG